MRDSFRWASIALVLSIPLVILGFCVAMRFAPLTPAQQLALQRLTAPTPPVKGEDASDAMWLLDLDVPEDRRAEVARQMRRYDYEKSQSKRAKDPAADWPRFPAPPQRGEGHCDAQAPEGCLAFVSEHRAEVAALLDANRGGVDALRDLWRYDGYRNEFPQTVSSGTPPLGARRSLLLSDFALRFESGEQLTAVDEVCLDLGGWRRIGGDADDLIVSVFSVDRVRQDLVLLADMLHRLPREAELPASCADALKPAQPQEFDLCPAARKDFEMIRGLRATVEAADDPHDPPSWAIDWRHLDAMHAEDLGRYCEPELIKRLRADQLIKGNLRKVPGCDRWEELADPYGCRLGGIGGPDYGPYLDRRGDQAQMLALMRTVIWLRSEVESKEAVPEALKRIPKDLGLLRAPDYDLDSDSLSIPLHDTRYQPRFQLAAGAEPRPTSHRRHMCCSRRPSRNLAVLDDANRLEIAP